jgi:hypothetical protein
VRQHGRGRGRERGGSREGEGRQQGGQGRAAGRRQQGGGSREEAAGRRQQGGSNGSTEQEQHLKAAQCGAGTRPAQYSRSILQQHSWGMGGWESAGGRSQHDTARAKGRKGREF